RAVPVVEGNKEFVRPERGDEVEVAIAVEVSQRYRGGGVGRGDEGGPGERPISVVEEDRDVIPGISRGDDVQVAVAIQVAEGTDYSVVACVVLRVATERSVARIEEHARIVRVMHDQIEFPVAVQVADRDMAGGAVQLRLTADRFEPGGCGARGHAVAGDDRFRETEHRGQRHLDLFAREEAPVGGAGARTTWGPARYGSTALR